MKKYLTRPTVPLEVNPKTTVRQLLEQMSQISFQGRNLGRAFHIYKQMLSDKTFIFLGLSGAMVPAGMRRIISFLIKNRYIDSIVSTGANIFHDIHESLGYYHYLGTHQCDDITLRKFRIDRIYDTFASEDEFIATDNFISDFGYTLPDKLYTTREFLYRLGQYIIKNSKRDPALNQVQGNSGQKSKLRDGIVTTAAKSKVPIYCAALGDSSVGIALTELVHRKNKKVKFDIIKDIEESAYLAASVGSSSVVYVGGGVPKNFIQQTEVTAPFLGLDVSGHKYAIQITQDAPQWGGLSGCTFHEAQSWGKIAFDAKTVILYADATLVLPILVTALAQEKIKRKFIPSFEMGENIKVKILQKRN